MGQSQAVTDVPALPPDAPILRVSAPGGPDGVVVGPDQPVLILGSRRDCDLTVESSEVAKIHAAIVHTGQAVLVADLCSRTGTWLDDQRVRRGVLTPGVRLRLGSVELVLDFEPPSLPFDAQQALRFREAIRLEGPAGTLQLNEQPIVIGRRSICDLVIDTPDTSLAHALIFELAGRPVIADLGSRSGTLLDEQRVRLAALHDGATLGIGGETFTVHMSQVAVPADQAPRRASAPPPDAAPTDAAAGSPVADEDIELLLAGIEQRIVSLRDQLRSELDALERRRRALHTREQQLDAQARDLEARTGELAQREAELNDRERNLDETAAALEREQKRLASGEKRLQQATRELAQRRRALEQAEARIQQRSAQLDSRQQQLEQASASIEAAQAELAQRRSRIEQREQALEARQRQLDEQAAKLEQARNALRQARQLLGNLDALVEDDLPAPTEADGAGTAESARSPNLLRRLLGNSETE